MYGINVDTARIVTDHMQTDADGVKNGLGDLVTVQIQPCSRDQCYGYHNESFLIIGQSSTAGAPSDIVREVDVHQSSKRVYACNIIANYLEGFSS